MFRLLQRADHGFAVLSVEQSQEVRTAMLVEIGRFGDKGLRNASEYVLYEETDVAQLLKLYDGPASSDDANLVCLVRRAGSSAPRHEYQGLWASNMPHWKQWCDQHIRRVYRSYHPEATLAAYRYCNG